jgi:hypothetical protein
MKLDRIPDNPYVPPVENLPLALFILFLAVCTLYLLWKAPPAR